MPIDFGNRKPHNHLGQRLAVSIGDTLIDSGVDAPAGNEQVIQLPASAYAEVSINAIQAVSWVFSANALAISDALKEQAADKRYLYSVQAVHQTGRDAEIRLVIADSPANPSPAFDHVSLSDAFGTAGQIVIESGGSRLIADHTDSVATRGLSSYAFQSGNAEIDAFIAAVSARAGNQAATLTLRDFVK